MSMPALSRSLTFNVVSNYAGTVWSGLIQLVMIPVYITLLGSESYGVIGFFITLQAVLQVFDFGLSPALNREMARSTALGSSGEDTGDLVRTVEYLAWGTAAAIGLSVFAASTLVVTRWIRLEALAPGDVENAIAFMGLALALQWPNNSYVAVLMGLERQVAINALKILASTISAIGAIVVLTFISPTVTAFFMWRACVLAVEVVVTRYVVWRAIRRQGSRPPRFRLTALHRMWRFSLGMGVIAMTVILLTQLDKLVLSRVLSMEYFGFYMVAASIANILPQMVSPVFTAVFPTLSKLVAAGELDPQKTQFHLCAQFVAVVVYPPAVCFMLFSHTIIDLWTRNERVAMYSGPVLGLLAIGAAVNSTMVLPYILQLAHGWTRLAIILNVVLVCLMVPYTVLAVRHFGIVGGASTWPLLNLLAAAVGASLTFKRLLPGEGWRWLVKDVAMPGTAALAAGAVVWLLMPGEGSRLMMAVKVISALLLSYMAAFMTAGRIRQRLPLTLAALRFQAAVRSSTP